MVGTAQAQTFPATPGTLGTIPDGPGTPTTCGSDGVPLVVEFEVSSLAEVIGLIYIDLTASHTWVGDVSAVLAAPGGTPSAPLFGHTGSLAPTACGDSSDLGATYTFADGSTNLNWLTAAQTFDPIPAGVYNASEFGGDATPEESILLGDAFRWMAPADTNGTWTLTVIDSGVGDTGAITAAGLNISLESGTIFTDRFESGDTSAWSVAVP
jgi:hypothetical protein